MDIIYLAGGCLRCHLSTPGLKMGLFDFAFLIALLAGLWFIFRVPSEYLLGYSKWLQERYGYLLSIFIGLYMAVMGIVISTIITEPGKHPLLEYVAGVLGYASIAVAAWDNYTFWKERYRNRNVIGEN